MTKSRLRKHSPQVSIIMGSSSDAKVMKNARDVLDHFGVRSEFLVVSAHRTPEGMVEYARMAKTRGIKVIIAAAGGAAHLPGMVASLTTLPVIGVPIDITTLKGLDAFLSIAQMPRGVPVATVGVDNAENAAHLAVRILAANEVEPRLQVLLEMWAKSQRQKVRKMNILLQTLKPRAPKRIQRKSRLRS